MASARFRFAVRRATRARLSALLARSTAKRWASWRLWLMASSPSSRSPRSSSRLASARSISRVRSVASACSTARRRRVASSSIRACPASTTSPGSTCLSTTRPVASAAMLARWNACTTPETVPDRSMLSSTTGATRTRTAVRSGEPFAGACSPPWPLACGSSQPVSHASSPAITTAARAGYAARSSMLHARTLSFPGARRVSRPT